MINANNSILLIPHTNVNKLVLPLFDGPAMMNVGSLFVIFLAPGSTFTAVFWRINSNALVMRTTTIENSITVLIIVLLCCLAELFFQDANQPSVFSRNSLRGFPHGKESQVTMVENF